MLTIAQLRLVHKAIAEALTEVYGISSQLRSDKQKKFVKVATEKIKQLSKDWKV